MAYLCYCDICMTPIKDGDEKYLFAKNKLIHDEIDKNAYKKYQSESDYLQDMLGKIQTRSNSVQTYEICKSCHRVLEHFLALRIERVKKIAKQLETLNSEGEIRDDREIL